MCTSSEHCPESVIIGFLVVGPILLVAIGDMRDAASLSEYLIRVVKDNHK